MGSVSQSGTEPAQTPATGEEQSCNHWAARAVPPFKIGNKGLILCRRLLLLSSIFPSIRVFSNESALCIRWPESWSFSFSIRKDEMVRWHHGLFGHEFEQTPGDSEGQGSLACCSPWGRRVRRHLASEQKQHIKAHMTWCIIGIQPFTYMECIILVGCSSLKHQ